MDIQKLTIGQMADLNGVTRETLRHYDREKLLIPWFTDPDSGYRYYHINQSARLDMILYLQSYGVPLKEIRQQLEEADNRALISLLGQQRQALDQDIQRLEQSRKAIDRMLLNRQRSEHLPRGQDPFFEYYPARRIFKHKTRANFFDQDHMGYELMLRELKESRVASNLPASYFWNIGTLVRQPHLESGCLYSDEVFFFVEDDYQGPGDIETLPPGLYACICSDDFSREAASAHALLAFIRQEGYRIAGDYVCEVIQEFPGFIKAPRELIFTMQIPVSQ